jgi:hypothetical protein
LASELRKSPTKIEIHIKKPQKTPSISRLKEKVLSEPVIKEALDLFDGKVLDFSALEKEENQ